MLHWVKLLFQTKIEKTLEHRYLKKIVNIEMKRTIKVVQTTHAMYSRPVKLQCKKALCSKRTEWTTKAVWTK